MRKYFQSHTSNTQRFPDNSLLLNYRHMPGRMVRLYALCKIRRKGVTVQLYTLYTSEIRNRRKYRVIRRSDTSVDGISN